MKNINNKRNFPMDYHFNKHGAICETTGYGENSPPCDKAEIEKIKTWLEAMRPHFKKTFRMSSYALKHLVEKSMGEYKSNGETIIAALSTRGYSVKYPGRGPNALVTISRKW